MVSTRKKPGLSGKGKYFHVEFCPSKNFVSFMTRDVGRKGHSQCVLGKHRDGKWKIQKWLISKGDAFISESGQLCSEDPKVDAILKSNKAEIVHARGDTFQLRPHRNLKMKKEGEMYFDSYKEYEKYYESLTGKKH